MMHLQMRKRLRHFRLALGPSIAASVLLALALSTGSDVAEASARVVVRSF